MRKRIVSLLCTAAVAGTLMIPAAAQEETLEAAAAANLEITAPSAVLMEASTGKVLYEKDSHTRRPPASVTKVMTMLLTMEAIDSGKIKMEDMVTASEYACGMGGSQVFLEPGEQMTVHDMLKAVAVASGNDAAAALAEHIAGSAESFVDQMNARARELGMNDTTFINCNGLDADGHETTAHDIALMSRELMRHPKIYEFTTIWMDSLRDGQFGLANTNKLIRFYNGATGLKTGSTGKAKFCVSATARRNDMDLIAVIMAAENSKDRFEDAKKLLDYGFANYAIASNTLDAAELQPVAVDKGAQQSVPVRVSGESSVLVEKGRVADVEKRVALPESVPAPVQEGDKIGSAEFYLGDQLIGSCDIVAAESVGRVNFFQMFTRLSRYFLTGK